MENLNRIELRGIVGCARVSELSAGKICNFTLATNFLYRSKDSNPVIETTWHRVVCFESKGIDCVDEIVKGAKVYVQGRIRMKRYVSADGIENSACEVVAKRVVLLNENETMAFEE